MILRYFILISLLLSAKFCFSATAGSTSLRFDPHQYTGTRGSEPSEQFVAFAGQRWNNEKSATPWEVSLHFEGETRGRRDVSLDLDRAWISFDSFTVGRIHPYDLSHHFDRNRPWGFLGSTQPQNKGLLLGYEFSGQETQPEPLLLGLLGLHYWSDASNTESFQWGASLSPLFIPTMGSEVSFSSNAPASVGRFARRPPGLVKIDGTSYPLYFEIDNSRLWQDVLLNPQVFAQAKWGNTWLVLSRAPSPDPLVSSLEDHLIVRPDSVHAFARVAPRFEQRVGATLTRKQLLIVGNWPTSLFASLGIFSNSFWGYEMGVETGYLTLSLLEERNYSTLSQEFKSNESRYTDLLGQADLRIPFESFVFLSGVKHHVRQNDLWLRSGLTYQASKAISVQSVLDIFAGPDLSYFGEWRTNDRASLVLRWEIES